MDEGAESRSSGSAEGRIVASMGLRAWLRRDQPSVTMTVGLFGLYMLGAALLIVAVPMLFAAALALFGQIGSGGTARLWGAAGLAVGLVFCWIGSTLMRRYGPW